jgi:hypothetical protein
MSNNISRNKILLGVGVLIVILVVIFAFFAFAKVDAAVTVNSAFCVNQIIDKQPANGKFLIMNVTVKNNGKDPLTVSTDQFAPMANGKPITKYSLFSGQGTDLQKQVTIPGGASKDITVVFDIGNQTPDSLEFFGPISWAPTYKNTSKISEVSPTAMFEGQNGTGAITMKMNASISNMKITMEMNSTDNSTVQKTDDPNKMKTITTTDAATSTNIAGQQNNQNNTDTMTSITDITTGLDEDGSPDILPKNITKPGDSLATSNGTFTLKDSETIDVMGKKIECWALTGQFESSGLKLNATMYFDKTTRTVVKAAIPEQSLTVSSIPFTVKGEADITSTNMPLIGVA